MAAKKSATKEIVDGLVKLNKRLKAEKESNGGQDTLLTKSIETKFASIGQVVKAMNRDLELEDLRKTIIQERQRMIDIGLKQGKDQEELENFAEQLFPFSKEVEQYIEKSGFSESLNIELTTVDKEDDEDEEQEEEQEEEEEEEEYALAM